MKEKQIIGRFELIDFPTLSVLNIPAKVDTGAFSSALHCSDIKFNKKTNELEFRLPSELTEEDESPLIKVHQFTNTRVKSSNGKIQNRYKINVKVKLGRKIFKTEFTLSDRSNMKFPVLLGRRALRNRYLVDVNKKYLLKPELKK